MSKQPPKFDVIHRELSALPRGLVSPLEFLASALLASVAMGLITPIWSGDFIAMLFAGLTIFLAGIAVAISISVMALGSVVTLDSSPEILFALAISVAAVVVVVVVGLVTYFSDRLLKQAWLRIIAGAALLFPLFLGSPYLMWLLKVSA